MAENQHTLLPRPAESSICKSHRYSGFTLIEVLVAITLLAIAGGVLLATQGSGSRLTRKALERETALWLAQARLTEALAYPDRSPPEDAHDERYAGIDYETRIEYRHVSPVPEIEFSDLPDHLRLIELRTIVRWGNPQSETVQLTAYRPYRATATPPQTNPGGGTQLPGNKP
jgi:prepilin-type N-terminal cleavage/methylation domain-containing protein